MNVMENKESQKFWIRVEELYQRREEDITLDDLEHNIRYARALVAKGKTFKNIDILSLAYDNGWTVAHDQAYRGVITHDKRVLLLRAEGLKKGPKVVATIQALGGSEGFVEDPDILLLEDYIYNKEKNLIKTTIGDLQEQLGWVPKTEGAKAAMFTIKLKEEKIDE